MYEESWREAATTFRDAVSTTQWRSAVQEVRTSLEPIGSRQLKSRTFTTSLPDAPAGEYVVLEFETSATGGQRVIETTIATREPNGKWRVSGYFVRPM